MTTESKDQNSKSKEKNNINHDMYLGAPAPLFRLAKQLRLEETAAEKLLWARLSRSQLGVKIQATPSYLLLRSRLLLSLA